MRSPCDTLEMLESALLEQTQAPLLECLPSPPAYPFPCCPQDSGKLTQLDILLRRLRAEGHRVLVFAQMTKMLNILEVSRNSHAFFAGLASFLCQCKVSTSSEIFAPKYPEKYLYSRGSTVQVLYLYSIVQLCT